MGQKVHPHGLRVGVIKDWDSRWYEDKTNFGDSLVEDDKVRKALKKMLYQAGISRIEIEKAAGRIRLFVHAAKPGIIIGRGGAEIDKVKSAVEKLTKKEVILNIVEVRNPDMDAQLVAENIASQLEKRISFRKAMKQCMGRTMKMGAKGIKTAVSGRLGGAEIARSEHYHEGTIPLQTLRADIDYGFCEAATTYGRIGVKVWIYKGEILQEGGKKKVYSASPDEPPRNDRPRNDRPRGDRPRGDRPYGDRPRGDRPQGQGQRPYQGGRPQQRPEPPREKMFIDDTPRSGARPQPAAQPKPAVEAVKVETPVTAPVVETSVGANTVRPEAPKAAPKPKAVKPKVEEVTAAVEAAVEAKPKAAPRAKKPKEETPE